MDTKLPIKLDKEVIDEAKIDASGRKLSLSRIIETYLQTLTREAKSEDVIEILSFVKSIYTGKSIPVDLDYKTAYSDYLFRKYK